MTAHRSPQAFHRFLRALCVLGLASLAAPATAQSALTDFAGRDPGVSDIIRALRPAEAAKQAAPGVRTRAIKFPAQQTAGVAAPATSDAANETDVERDDGGPRKASFDQIRFRFDSAELTADARRMLDRIGQALASDDLRGLRFVVEGHTDAVGPDDYNLTLSQRRAETVQRYLTGRFGIAPGALMPVGKGEQDLLDAGDPASPVNRRVVIGVIER